MKTFMRWLDGMLLAMGVSGCSVTSSFDMPKCTHAPELPAKYAGQWVAHPEKNDEPTIYLELKPYHVSEELLRQLPEKDRQDVDQKCHAELFDTALRVRTVPAAEKADSDGSLPVPDWVPLAGFFFQFGEHEYLCVTWDFLNYIGGNYSLEHSLQFVSPRYYVLEVALSPEGRLSMQNVTFLKPGDKPNSAAIPTVDKLNLYDGNIVLNSGKEIAQWIEQGQYHREPYAVFIRENWREDSTAK